MNYSTVVSSVQSWFEDDGTEFLAAIPQLIELGERRIFKDAPNLLANRTTATGNLVSGTATLTVPTGLRVVRGLSITVTNAQVFLERRIDSWLYDKCVSRSGGFSKGYRSHWLLGSKVRRRNSAPWC